MAAFDLCNGFKQWTGNRGGLYTLKGCGVKVDIFWHELTDLTWPHQLFRVFLYIITQLRCNKNDRPLLTTSAALCVYTMKCHVYRRPPWRTGVNLLPEHGPLCLCSSSLPWPSSLMNMYGQVRSSTTARALGTGATENTKIRSIDGSVSARPHLLGLAENTGMKRKYITCWGIRLPTSWWHTKSHCCRYGSNFPIGWHTLLVREWVLYVSMWQKDG